MDKRGKLPKWIQKYIRDDCTSLTADEVRADVVFKSSDPSSLLLEIVVP